MTKTNITNLIKNQPQSVKNQTQTEESTTKCQKSTTKSTIPWLFGLSNAVQNGMIWLGSTKDHTAAWLQGKGLGEGQGLSGGDLARVLPTQKLLQSNLGTPENFVQFCPSFQKLIMIFSYRHTYAKTP